MSTWLLLSLSAAVLWTIAPILAKKGFLHISSLWNNIFANIFAFIIWIPAVLILSDFKISFPSLSILLALFVAESFYMFFFYAIAKADISLTSPLSALYPISAVLLSYVFLHERITSIQTVGISIAIGGVFLIALPKKNFTSIFHLKDKSWLWWGLFSATISGTADFLSKLSSNKIGSYSQIFFIALIAQLMSLINYAVDRNGRKLPKFSFGKFSPTLLGTFFSILGMLLFLLAFRYGKASLIVPVSSVYPAFVVLFAGIFLHEKIHKKQIIGILCITTGIICVGFGM